MPDSVDALETALFLEALYQRYGADFRQFDGALLTCRLAAAVRSHGCASISALQGAVLRDAATARRTMRALSGSDSALPASVGGFMALRRAAAALLRSKPWPALWLADCADAGLLLRLTAMLEEEGIGRTARLFVTHANEDLLAGAAPVGIDAATLARWDAAHRRSGGQRPLRDYCSEHGDGFALLPDLQQRLVWGQHDLVSGASLNEFQLIVCQRPLADYTLALRRRVLALFGQSLCRFGVLQIDAPPDLNGVQFAGDFVAVDALHGVYRRSASQP